MRFNTEVDGGPRRPGRWTACGCGTRSPAEWDEPIEGLFVAIGYRPNTEVFRDWLEVDERAICGSRRDRVAASTACSSPATSTTTTIARP